MKKTLLFGSLFTILALLFACNNEPEGSDGTPPSVAMKFTNADHTFGYVGVLSTQVDAQRLPLLPYYSVYLEVSTDVLTDEAEPTLALTFDQAAVSATPTTIPPAAFSSSVSGTDLTITWENSSEDVLIGTFAIPASAIANSLFGDETTFASNNLTATLQQVPTSGNLQLNVALSDGATATPVTRNYTYTLYPVTSDDTAAATTELNATDLADVLGTGWTVYQPISTTSSASDAFETGTIHAQTLEWELSSGGENDTVSLQLALRADYSLHPGDNSTTPATQYNGRFATGSAAVDDHPLFVAGAGVVNSQVHGFDTGDAADIYNAYTRGDFLIMIDLQSTAATSNVYGVFPVDEAILSLAVEAGDVHVATDDNLAITLADSATLVTASYTKALSPTVATLSTPFAAIADLATAVGPSTDSGIAIVADLATVAPLTALNTNSWVRLNAVGTVPLAPLGPIT